MKIRLLLNIDEVLSAEKPDVVLVQGDVEETQKLLDDESAYRQMARVISPYGDGQASERIVRVLRDHFSTQSKLP